MKGGGRVIGEATGVYVLSYRLRRPAVGGRCPCEEGWGKEDEVGDGFYARQGLWVEKVMRTTARYKCLSCCRTQDYQPRHHGCFAGMNSGVPLCAHHRLLVTSVKPTRISQTVGRSVSGPATRERRRQECQSAGGTWGAAAGRRIAR